MKKRYFLKTFSAFLFAFLLFAGGNLTAQNRYYLDFDGSNDYVKYTDDATLGRMDGATDYTLEAWIFPVDGRVAEYDRVFQRYYSFAIVMYDGNNDGNVEDWYFQVYDKGSSSWKYYNTEGDATLTLDAWNHITVINNSTDGTLKLFVNGVDVTTTGGYSNRNMPSSSNSDNLFIGQKGNGASYFGGYIDEVRLKNVAENPDNLHCHLYDNQYTSDANTAALFHFNKGTGTTTVNEASSANATLNNGVTWRTWNHVSTDHLPLAYEWTGSSSTDWATAGNWNHGVPADFNDVLIPDVSNDPSISEITSAECNNLLIETNATLTLASSASGTGSLIINGTASGTANVNCYITGYNGLGNSKGWHFFSSPVENQAIQTQFVTDPPTSSTDFYKWDETASTENWINSKASDGSWNSSFESNFVVGRGYLIGYENNVTKTFSGTPNTGTQSITLSNTDGSGGQGWNLAGNPYTSGIDWDNIDKSSGVNGTVYVYTSAGSYISWNGSTGDLTDGIIPPMDGFFVYTSADNATLTLNNGDMVNSNHNVYKSEKKPENTLKISLTDNINQNNTYIQFRDDATKSFDMAIDGFKLFGMGTCPELYTRIDETLYSINCLPSNLGNYDLPMGIKIEKSGQYTLNFSGFDSFANGITLVLEDLKTGKTQEVVKNPVFTFTQTPEDDEMRFLLHFYGINGLNNNWYENPILIYTCNKGVYLKSSNKILNGTFEIVNLLGQVVYTQKIDNLNFVTVYPKLENGVYIVRFHNSNGRTTSQKIVLQ